MACISLSLSALGDYVNATTIVFELNKRSDITGYYTSGSLDEMQQFPDRMKGCYQIIIEPFNPDLRDELLMVFELNAGPDAKLDTSELFRGKDDIVLESVVKPYAPDFPNQGEPYPGTSVKVTVRPELKFNPDHSVCYPQLTLVGVDRYREEFIDWALVPDNGYNF